MLYLQSSGTPADRSEAWTEAHIVAASPKFSDGTGLEPAVTERAVRLAARAAFSYFPRPLLPTLARHGVVDD